MREREQREQDGRDEDMWHAVREYDAADATAVVLGHLTSAVRDVAFVLEQIVDRLEPEVLIVEPGE